MSEIMIYRTQLKYAGPCLKNLSSLCKAFKVSKTVQEKLIPIILTFWFINTWQVSGDLNWFIQSMFSILFFFRN